MRVRAPYPARPAADPSNPARQSSQGPRGTIPEGSSGLACRFFNSLLITLEIRIVNEKQGFWSPHILDIGCAFSHHGNELVKATATSRGFYALPQSPPCPQGELSLSPRQFTRFWTSLLLSLQGQGEGQGEAGLTTQGLLGSLTYPNRSRGQTSETSELAQPLLHPQPREKRARVTPYTALHRAGKRRAARPPNQSQAAPLGFKCAEP